MTNLDLKIDLVKRKPICLGAGFIALDIVKCKFDDFAAVGGSCGNVLSILAWMGWRAMAIGRLGDDAAGDFVRTYLESVNVETDYFEQADRIATPIVIQKFVDTKFGDRSHRFSLSCPDCGGWLPRYRPMTLKLAARVIEDALAPKVYYFDRVSPASLRLASWAQEQGALILFEPSSIGDDRAFQKAIDLCHILKYSHERLGHVPDLAAAIAPKIVIETLGENGVRVRWRARWNHLRAFKASRFVDAAGSGDWFSAGIIHRLGHSGSDGLFDLRKPDLERALKFGSALAAVNCGFEGARGAMLTLSVDEFNKVLLSLDDALSVDNFEGISSGRVTNNLPKELCGTCSGRSEVKSLKRSA